MCACPATHGLSYVRDWDILVFDLGVNIDSIDHGLECTSGYSFYIRIRICIICFYIFSGID